MERQWEGICTVQESPFEADQNDSQPSTIEDPTVWDRLRRRMDEIAASRSGEINAELLAKKLALRAKTLRRRVEENQASDGDLCAFVAFNQRRQRYGIRIGEILEIKKLDQFASVPGSPRFIPGVIHWRGAVLALLDLERLFEVPELGLADLSVCIIVEAAGARIAVAAAEIEDIVIVPVNQLRAAPELPGDIPDAWIAGVHDENRLVLCMDELLRDTRLVNFRRQAVRDVARSR